MTSTTPLYDLCVSTLKTHQPTPRKYRNYTATTHQPARRICNKKSKKLTDPTNVEEDFTAPICCKHGCMQYFLPNQLIETRIKYLFIYNLCMLYFIN